MSKTPSSTANDVLGLESPLEALQTSPQFRGPVEPMDGDFCNDHFALIYESRDDQFAAIAPFIRQGLERGERCMYVVGEDEATEVRSALRESGIDVDAAVESGALVIETIENTYLKTGSFDADEMMDRYAEIIEEATADYEAFRLAAEMSWILEADVSVEESMAYESKVNALFDDEDAIAVCQYDRNRFPPTVLRDVVRVHPHLIYDNTVCHNFYYTPPEEFCGPNQPRHELDRMLGTLLDRTEAKTELQERERYQQRQNEIISDPDSSFEEKLQDLFDLGSERFDLELGGMARVDPDDDRFELEYVSGDHDRFEPGVELPLSETFCALPAETGSTASVADPAVDGYADLESCREFGVRAYLGTYLEIDGGSDRTFAFVGPDARDEPFSDDEHAFLQSMGQWVKYELEQHHRERELERTVDRLEESNERLEQFAYAASHDLQEPLRMVSSYLQLIERRTGDDLSEEIREFLSFAVDGAERMRRMIEGLLAYSRVETRGEPLEPVELDEVVEDVRENLQVRLDETDAELSVEPLPRVQGDGNQLRQLLQNLLSNAIKYSGETPPRIEVTAERNGNTWKLSVRDDGIGIEDDERERIFDIFDRLHGREEYDGTGIGLALCERIVERHGGEIWVDAEPGEGSTFSFTLRKAAPAE
ncbi:MEDS domain-containing protein [Haloterrigena sp. SYSU A558-1]|uniref:histidine kinase n=1 Tax=Haloterrigena gelatinilytica TaxID=2741724 RepID=A0A8J8GPQ3_9EURY|nr:MEDS domain-containing protein [Haloterrigena gelatinilytica]NUB92985.1 MEDS domain-containing protein [Haloterrigena gelatinilytica]NUC71101.1 MEDS domain-containing protein [Haloterrigena gelatinilytica]